MPSRLVARIEHPEGHPGHRCSRCHDRGSACIGRLDIAAAWLHSGPMQPMAHLFQGHHGQVAEAVLEALRGYEDPVVRYANLSRAQAIYEELVRKIGAERAVAAREMHDGGRSYAQIAETAGITRARAQQLVEKASQANTSKKAGKKA